MTNPAASSTTSASSSATPSPGPYVHAISMLELPTFSIVNTSSWYQRAEIQLRLWKIMNSQTMANHVLAAISKDLFPQISAWLTGQGDQLSYYDLKAYLLCYFSLTTATTLQESFNFISNQWEISMQVWRGVNSRPYLVGHGNSHTTDLLQEMWLSSIPAQTLATLADAEGMVMENLFHLADSFIDSHCAS